MGPDITAAAAIGADDPLCGTVTVARDLSKSPPAAVVAAAGAAARGGPVSSRCQLEVIRLGSDVWSMCSGGGLAADAALTGRRSKRSCAGGGEK